MAEVDVGFWKRGSELPFHQLRDLGEGCEFACGFRVGAPSAQRFYITFGNQDCLTSSPDTNLNGWFL